jgi:hypothetical protein
VYDGDIGHNKIARENGEDVTAFFAVGGCSVQKAIHCMLASSAHTSLTGNVAPIEAPSIKHVMVQRNCFGAG